MIENSRWCFGIIGTAHEGKWIPVSELITSGYPIFASFNDVGGLYVCKNCNKKLRWAKKISTEPILRKL